MQTCVQSSASFETPSEGFPLPSGDMELRFFSSRVLASGVRKGGISAFSIRDPHCDFTPHTVSLNTPTGQRAGAKNHSCIHSQTRSFVHPSIRTCIHALCEYTYSTSSAIIPKLQPNFFRAADSVTVESICSAEAVRELRGAEELINNAAERSRWLGMEERSVCPRGLEIRPGPCRQSDRLVPSGQRATNTSIT